jgi:superfamily II DNA or RNA helicase
LNTNLKNIEFSKDRVYRTQTSNEPLSFYLYALSNSIKFDLLLGYFSSSAINILSLGFATFLYNGGKMRIVANDVLSENDANAIKNSETINSNSKLIDLYNIKSMRDSLDEYNSHFFNCISWLIANNRIEIVLIKPKNSKGIAHYKSGIFYDGIGNKVQFKASCNFTYYGLVENLEELDVNLSWEESSELKIKSYESYFVDVFNKKSDVVEYIDVNDVLKNISETFPVQTLENLIIDEQTLIDKKAKLLQSKNLIKSLDKISDIINNIYNQPRFPSGFTDGARPYQIEAYKNWVNNDYTGIFAMATGTGKTITALNCLLNLYQQESTYKAVILVPTVALLQQWKKECESFNFKNIILVSSNTDWLNQISKHNTHNKFSNTSFIIIVTYVTFSKSKFQSIFNDLPIETMLIGDEVHNMGSPNLLKILPNIKLKRKLGLSATPHRKYDEESNGTLNNFFNDKPPYLYEFSMERALQEGRLCNYTYTPHLVQLTEEENKEYLKYTQRLMLYFDQDSKKYKNSKEVTDLLLKRKNIINKASNKILAFRRVIQEVYIENRNNLKYTLVYVPEGSEPDYANYEEYVENEDDKKLINDYTRIVSEVNQSILVRQYTSQTIDRNRVIDDFTSGKIDVLTSMKCLDEGVDIPRSEIAIFCASSGNPRQFIQRRGRVLRNHIDKSIAKIHDLVVIPYQSHEEKIIEAEKSMINNELQRVIDFASLSLNKIDTYEILKPILEKYNLNLYN